MWGVGPRCDGGPFSADWSPLASAGTVTAAALRWITLWSYAEAVSRAMPMQYLYYRYCIGFRQAHRRNLWFLRRNFLARHQNRCWSGALVTPCMDTSG